MINNENIYKSIIYNENIYKSSIYIPTHEQQALKKITFIQPGFLTQDFVLLDIDPAESNVDRMPAEFELANIVSVSMELGGDGIKDPSGTTPATHFTRGRRNVVFSDIEKGKWAFWVVGFDLAVTKAVYIEFRRAKHGLSIRAIQAEYIDGDFPMTNWNEPDTGNFAELAISGNQNGYGVTNVRVTFSE